VPHFWLGLMMISLFAVNLHWLPASGYVPFSQHPIENLRHMVMPAIVLGTGLSAVLMRQMRSSMLNSLGADYVRTARAKGLPERSVVLKHALRNSLIPIITVFANILPILISGSLIVEAVFGIPGMGLYAYEGLQKRDYPIVLATTTLSAVMTMLGILLSDLLYAVVDPRISYD